MTGTTRGDGLEAIEPFINEIMQTLRPAERKRLATRIMRIARQANARRVAANVTPDGAAMAPRKKRKGKRGKMFKRIERARSLKISATEDGGELRFANSLVEATAAVHHYGLTGFVGRTRTGRIVRTKYQARQLLGFGEERDQFLDAVIDHLDHRR